MVVRILGLTRGDDESPREITRNNQSIDNVGENGWLIRFLDSAFFSEWIAVSYLYKHDHSGVRDYLCNRMYTLPLSGLESYLFQICYMLVHKPSPSLDKFVIDICSKSLKIALKVHWFLIAELEDSDDNEGIGRIQEKCQIAATLMGEWAPLVRLQNDSAINLGKNKVLNRWHSSKQRLLSLTSSHQFRKSFSFSPSSGNNLQDEGSSSKASQDENNMFKKFIPSQKVRDALRFRKSVYKDNEESEKDGFFTRLLRDSKEEDVGTSMERDDEDKEKDGFFSRFLKDSKDENEVTSSSDSFLKRIFSKGDLESVEGDDDKEGYFNKFIKEKFEDKQKDIAANDDEEYKEKQPGSPKQKHDRSNPKPPLPNTNPSQFRKGTYHESLEFVQSLCDTSYCLVDVFPVEERKSALCESLSDINDHVVAAQSSGGLCFPMGKGMYRVVHIPEDEAILLNSRDKAPYLICVEVLKSETSSSNTKDHKLSKGGTPLANGDANLPKRPPWANPLPNRQDMYLSSFNKISRTTSQAIDEAMSSLWDSNAKFVHVSLLVENQISKSKFDHECGQTRDEDGDDVEWVRVELKADPGVHMDDIAVQEPPRRREHRRVPSMVAFEEVKAAALRGGVPPGLCVKRSSQESSEAESKDVLSGELWEAKKDRIRQASVYGKFPGWDLVSVIVKSGDDCRQEHLAVQLISHFYDIFQEAGLPLWLRPYEVLVTSSYTALIETIPDTASLHSIKSRYPDITSLRDFFIAKYQENSPSYKLSQRNFVESMAGYSLVCYLLQVKDRHNGNLLLDEEGHLIHIDFGFMLSNSPGGVNFESAPFKLTRELLEVMDSDAEGVSSEFFDYFKVLCIQGFLTCRKHAEQIILLVEMLQDSGFPCFKGGPRTVQNLRKRFHLSLTEEQCVSLVLSLISSSLDAWRTRQYDYYQRVLNGIL
ncbi:phosphatidylinositol 4-kinase beta 1 isoform X1 [Lactuca sativa]|uniref:1-phosphatidylinositol 4-kinase n=1 Tax=Lactuca sativa TaxID=4236 RepID=A0A9R1VJ14_LACSA|nr:phosphatidylinositol 4-kinase beta 1 isoform X1 [Lactuca sativa]XP_052620228.1 phosphatidylinositol 4-kinase beta 1 isoform X1 [Lactuca sativa]KAJ0205583.1 hypothetical protein LSAT_V11C500243900 [Lactuca sativa]